MIIFAIHLDGLRLKVGAGPGTDGTQATDGVAIEYFAAIVRHKDPMDVHLTVMDVASTLEDERDFGVEGEQVKIVKFYGGSTSNLT